MRFKSYYLINELFSNWTYYVPSDKEHLLFDFYALSLVHPDKLNDIDMKLAFKEAQEKIVNTLVKDFKYALMYALSSEFRHIYGFNTAIIAPQDYETAEDFFKEIKQEKFFYRYAKEFKKKYEKYRQLRLQRALTQNDFSRDDSYNAIVKTKLPETAIARVFSKTFLGSFFRNRLGRQYGGKPWAMIADAWGRLYTTKGTKNLMVLIDHIYDLQHNNDTVFNKVNDYYKKHSIGWLKIALNFKRDIKDPFALYDKISPGLQDPFAYVMKLQDGITLQSFREKEKMRIKRGDSVKIKPFDEIKKLFEDPNILIRYRRDALGYEASASLEFQEYIKTIVIPIYKKIAGKMVIVRGVYGEHEGEDKTIYRIETSQHQDIVYALKEMFVL